MTASTSNENFCTPNFVMFLWKGSLQIFQQTALADYDRLAVHHCQNTPTNTVLEGFRFSHLELSLLGISNNSSSQRVFLVPFCTRCSFD